MRVADKSVSKIEAVIAQSDNETAKYEPSISLMVDVPLGMRGTEVLLTMRELKRLLKLCATMEGFIDAMPMEKWAGAIRVADK